MLDINTKLYNGKNINENEIRELAECFSSGGIIAFPTETVYGIGADFNNPKAIAGIFEIKGRPSDNPLSVYISDLNQVEKLFIEIPDIFWKLADAFLPGPLAIIMKKSRIVSDLVTAGLDTVAIRFPDNELLLKILKEFGSHIAGTSANLSSQPPATDGEQVEKYMSGKIAAIIDDGETKYKQESTIIKLTDIEPVILRHGVISDYEIKRVLNIS